MTGSIFDPPLWAWWWTAIPVLVGDPWMHGVIAAMLFTLVKRALRGYRSAHV